MQSCVQLIFENWWIRYYAFWFHGSLGFIKIYNNKKENRQDNYYTLQWLDSAQILVKYQKKKKKKMWILKRDTFIQRHLRTL